MLPLGGQCAMQVPGASCGPIGGEYTLPNRFAPDNTLEVSREGKRYRFRLAAFWANRPNDGSQTHNGTSEGRFSVNNCRAQFDDRENVCRLVLVFKGKKAVRIEQEDACVLFGASVDATGDYRKK
jgi:hypothetical protein